MNDSDSGKCLLAAIVALLLADSGKPLTDSVTISTAERVVLTSISDDNLACSTCRLLSRFGMRPAFVTPLRSLLSHSNEHTAIAAAAALSHIDTERITAFRCLRTALTHNNSFVGGLAGASLLRMGFEDSQLVDLVAARIPALDDDGLYQVFFELARSQLRSASLCNAIITYLSTKNDAHRMLLRIALIAMARMSPTPEMVTPVLHNLFHSDDNCVLDGVITGMKMIGRFPANAEKRFVDSLTHPNSDMREVSIHGLRAMGIMSPLAIEALVARLCDEPIIWLREQAVAVIGDIGSAAIPSLVRVIVSRDISGTEFAMRALQLMGEDGANAIATELLSATDDRLRLQLVVALTTIAARSPLAIRQLAQELDETTDAQTATYATIALYSCGAYAAPAVHSLIQCIRDDWYPEEARTWAQRALADFAPIAIPAVEESLVSSTGDSQSRLARCLLVLRASYKTEFAKFDSFSDDTALYTFVAVARAISDSGDKQMSFRSMQSMFAEQKRSRTLPSRFSSSSGTLRLHVAKLERHIKNKLLDRDRLHACTLTASGRACLREAQEYLALKEFKRRTQDNH